MKDYFVHVISDGGNEEKFVGEFEDEMEAEKASKMLKAFGRRSVFIKVVEIKEIGECTE